MKTLMMICILCVAGAAAQEPAVTANQMIVYGTATLEKAADRALINLTLKGFGPTLEAAINQTKTKVREVSRKLFAIGLKESSLYTSSFNSGDNFEGKAFWSSNRDFRTQIDMVVTVDSLELLEPVVSVLAAASPERLSNITFALRSDSLMKLETRRLAVANAQQKATLMAGQLGVGLVRVLHVEELQIDGDLYTQGRYAVSFARVATQSAVAEAEGGSFYGKMFSVKAGVKVVFEIRAGK